MFEACTAIESAAALGAADAPEIPSEPTGHRSISNWPVMARRTATTWGFAWSTLSTSDSGLNSDLTVDVLRDSLEPKFAANTRRSM
jgi:hypothetical protein